jgi:hypothetical protein
MRMRFLVVPLALGVVLAAACGARAQAPDPFLGSWKLDIAKSTLVGPAPKSLTVAIEPAGEARKVTVDGVGVKGESFKWGYTATLDGKDAVVTGTPAFDTASISQSNPRESSVTYKKAGKVVSTLKTAVSADGKTMTVTSTPAEPAGKPTTQLYTKQ